MTQAQFLNRIRSVLDRQPGRWEFVAVSTFRSCVKLIGTSELIRIDYVGDAFIVDAKDEATADWWMALFDVKKHNDAGVVA